MAKKKRLIDANALKSEFEWLLSVVNLCNKDKIRDTIERIEKAPTVDAVEVVRCKDCKHGEPTVNAIGEPSIACNNSNIGFFEWILDEDDFCSYGERRKDGTG